MSRLHDVIEKWRTTPPYEGLRVANESEINALTEKQVQQIEFLVECMEKGEVVVFEYEEKYRVAVPFVIGISSEGNSLARCWQLEGKSKSGKGAGWRVYQVDKMLYLESHFQYFDFQGVGFNRNYPWIYKVIHML